MSTEPRLDGSVAVSTANPAVEAAAVPVPDLVAGPVGSTELGAELSGGHGAGLGAQVSAGVTARTRQARSENTVRAYDRDWAAFTRWCARTGSMGRAGGFDRGALPASPQTVAEYLAEAADTRRADGSWAVTASTLSRWVAAINFVHRRAGHPLPGGHELVQDFLAGLRRTRAQPPRRSKALSLTDLTAVLDGIETKVWPAAVIGRRDAALLLVAWASAARRSEVAALDRSDVTAHPADGLHLQIRVSKTDPGAAGQVVAIPFGTRPGTCAACRITACLNVVDAWDTAGRVGVMTELRRRPTTGHVCHLEHPTPSDRFVPPGAGPLFRPVTKAATIGNQQINGRVVHAVVRRRLEAVGLPSAGFGAHSLRAGFVTDAFRAGAHAIMRQTRHRSPTTLEAYARHYTPLETNAVTTIGL
ncbi:hypothetical protein [Lapillicoccus sp.]|uniref:hypothetical protein n=1 Tax=Lapillicoccus sp. TaxID=1909287 RepID=UPI0025DF151B|nr:hypothetical protein [Lapillicoccus sp.]